MTRRVDGRCACRILIAELPRRSLLQKSLFAAQAAVMAAKHDKSRPGLSGFLVIT